jgi:hypothetical protein
MPRSLTTFFTYSRPALRAAACGGHPRPERPPTGRSDGSPTLAPSSGLPPPVRWETHVRPIVICDECDAIFTPPAIVLGPGVAGVQVTTNRVGPSAGMHPEVAYHPATRIPGSNTTWLVSDSQHDTAYGC